MKFAKKILVGMLVASMLICTLVLSSSAQSSAKNPAYYENILEYGDCLVYFEEDFEEFDLTTGSDYTDKVYPAPQPPSADVGAMRFHNAALVASEDENQFLKVTSTDTESYFRWVKNAERPTSLVASFSVKLGDADANNGSVVSLILTMADYFEAVEVLTIDARAESGKVSYATFNERFVEYSSVTSSATLTLGAWYDVDVIFNADEGKTYITVSDGETDIVSVSTPANVSTGIDSLRLVVDNKDKTTETVTYFDNIELYEGKIVRDIRDSDNSLAKFVIEMDTYSRASERTIEEKLAMADLYSRFFPGYVPENTLTDYEQVKAIVDSATAYINQAHADAFIEYVTDIMTKTTCYDKIDYQQNVVKPFYDYFPADEGDINAMDGMSDIFSGETTYGEKVFDAKTQYDDATKAIDKIKVRSAAFVKQLETSYDPHSMDYIHMTTQRDALAVFIPNVDPAYKYASKDEPLGNPASDYKTAGDAIAAYEALVAKIAEIEQTVQNFIPKVEILSKTEADSVSADNPYLTVNFPELYQNFTVVKALCNNGVVHSLLDSDTYPGLAEVIVKFEEYKTYVEAREAECNNFVSLVNGAANVGLYYTTLEQLDIAAKYLDTDKEFSLEKHTGVEAAITLYYQLRDKLVVDMENAEKYKAAVAAINMDASYSDLRAKVNAAIALRDKGAIVGITGIKEANVTLIEAERRIVVYESNSQTLKNCVEQLKTSTDLAERRALIFTANSVKDKAQDAIEGVSTAKTELQTEIQRYNTDVAAANEQFEGIVTDIVSISAGACPTQGMYKMLTVATSVFN